MLNVTNIHHKHGIFQKSLFKLNKHNFPGSLHVSYKLTHSFPMHPFSTPWKHQKGVEKGYIGNEWVKGLGLSF